MKYVERDIPILGLLVTYINFLIFKVYSYSSNLTYYLTLQVLFVCEIRIVNKFLQIKI